MCIGSCKGYCNRLCYGSNMPESTDVTFMIKPHKAFRGRNLAGGHVKIVSYEGQVVGDPGAFEIEHELQRVETTMIRRHAEGAFFFMGVDAVEDDDMASNTPSPGVFLARMLYCATSKGALQNLQERPLVLNEGEISKPLDDTHGVFDPQIDGAYAIVNQKRELRAVGIGLSFNGTLLALEGMRRSLVVASPEALMYQTNSYYGGRHSLHRILRKPLGIN